MRDMIPPGDRSIRNIPIPKGHKHVDPEALEETYYPPEPPQAPRRARRKRRPGRFVLLALIVMLVVGGGVAGVSMLYAGAHVAVTPRIETVEASAAIPAALNAPMGMLSYTTIMTTEWATTTVPANGTKRASRQAKGTVTITSTYSASQRFIANTRLEAPDGKIYRLASSVDVPAGGSVSVAINAESPGESYNRSGETAFTFPGFAGDPRFKTFTAKSNGAISGGFVGEEPAVADADLKKAQDELRANLGESVTAALTAKLPQTATGIPGALAIEYGEVMQTASADKKTVTLSQSATATGAIVAIRDLASALARKTVQNYNGEAVDFLEQGSLSISVSTSTKPTDPEMTLNVSGQTTLVWQFDPNALKAAMLGKDKGQFQTIVESFAPAVAEATATIRPFWIKNFPTDPEKIDIEIVTKQ